MMNRKPEPIRRQVLSDVLFADLGMLYFKCPGCDNHHGVQVVGTTGPVWQWNNDVNKPTFSPSVRTRSYDKDGERNCHMFVEEGKLRFLNDCTHDLKGQTVDMIPMTLSNVELSDQS